MSENSAILAAATSHFDKMKGQEIEIPEWGDPQTGAPLVAFYDPPSLTDRKRINTRSKNNEPRQLALTVILHLKDGAGKPIFADDAETLATMVSKVDPAAIGRVAQKILGVSEESDLGN